VWVYGKVVLNRYMCIRSHHALQDGFPLLEYNHSTYLDRRDPHHALAIAYAAWVQAVGTNRDTLREVGRTRARPHGHLRVERVVLEFQLLPSTFPVVVSLVLLAIERNLCIRNGLGGGGRRRERERGRGGEEK
jgi:hypothetical protein